MDKTPHFFIERYGNLNKKTPGGAHKAKIDQCKFFVYFYIKDMTAFFFLTDDIVQFIDQNSNKYKPVSIPNRGYVTFGYLVPRKDMEHIIKKKIIFNSSYQELI